MLEVHLADHLIDDRPGFVAYLAGMRTWISPWPALDLLPLMSVYTTLRAISAHATTRRTANTAASDSAQAA